MQVKVRSFLRAHASTLLVSADYSQVNPCVFSVCMCVFLLCHNSPTDNESRRPTPHTYTYTRVTHPNIYTHTLIMQIEMRILAAACGDEGMARLFQQQEGDIYRCVFGNACALWFFLFYLYGGV